MSVSELLAELKECGVELVATEGQLRYRPREAVTSQPLDQLKKHKPQLMKLLESEQYRFQGGDCYSEDSHPEVRNLIAGGWKPKEHCGKTIWESPENGFWYSQDMALELLRLDPLAQPPYTWRVARGGGFWVSTRVRRDRAPPR